MVGQLPQNPEAMCLAYYSILPRSPSCIIRNDKKSKRKRREGSGREGGRE